MGDTVNLAARLAEAAPDGRDPRGPHDAPPHLPVVRLRDAAADDHQGQGRAGGRRPARRARAPTPDARAASPAWSRRWSGATRSSARSSPRCRRLAAGTGGVVAVTGDPGMGKSRLVAEVRQRTEAEARWIEGRAQSYTDSMSYWMARSLLSSLHRPRPRRGTGGARAGVARRARAALRTTESVRRRLPVSRATLRPAARRADGRAPGRALARGAAQQPAARLRGPRDGAVRRAARSSSCGRTCTGPTRRRWSSSRHSYPSRRARRCCWCWPSGRRRARSSTGIGGRVAARRPDAHLPRAYRFDLTPLTETTAAGWWRTC